MHVVLEGSLGRINVYVGFTLKFYCSCDDCVQCVEMDVVLGVEFE
jgi:hypothetical protein